jgi:squalene-hopene/tetraprenyl-beta-curcumene cyclase
MRRVLAIVVAALLSGGCSRPEPEPPRQVTTTPHEEIPPPRAVPTRSVARALARGVDYLLARQSPDGAWRSDVYATFKDGTALTPLVISALQQARDAGEHGEAIETAITKGLAWLTTFNKSDGVVDPGPDGFDYPVYTAALAIKCLSHPTGKDFAKHRAGWVKYLLDRQLTEKLGWNPEDKQYGGWGYCRVAPRKPAPNTFSPPLVESNLSATLFALDALKSAGQLHQEVVAAARVFVRRCQNDDGGFHFIYDDPVRNKAGIDGRDPLAFHSYGSTTADGLLALDLCGLDMQAARGWLMKHFRADTHPGIYVAAHEPNREAVYYYFVASVARAFSRQKPELPDGRDWAAELGRELARRQREDGRWENPVELVRENDPLVATANAVCALVYCTP